MRKTTLAAIGMLGLGLTGTLPLADTLQMPAAGVERTAVPARGMTMAEVEQRYGAPTEKVAAVGQPPISRWVYPSFIVYFEHQLVIHAVATPTAAK